MKILLLITFLCTAQLFGFVDMSNQMARAADLGLELEDYVSHMALAGIATGFIFNLFLWKVR